MVLLPGCRVNGINAFYQPTNGVDDRTYTSCTYPASNTITLTVSPPSCPKLPSLVLQNLYIFSEQARAIAVLFRPRTRQFGKLSFCSRKR